MIIRIFIISISTSSIIMTMWIMMTYTEDSRPLVVARIVGWVVSEVPVSGVGQRSLVSPVLPVGGLVEALQSSPLRVRKVGVR